MTSPAPGLQVVIHRLEKVERQNRRLKHTARAAMPVSTLPGNLPEIIPKWVRKILNLLLTAAISKSYK
jgi:hypothetical protein